MITSTSTRKANTYSPAFQRYLHDLFEPAQAWAGSAEGCAWIAENIPSLADLIDQHYDSCLFGSYSIELNGRTLYIGESIRTVRRLIVHAYNIAHHPELFGLAGVDLSRNKITVKLLESNLFNKMVRKATELHYIKLRHPLLQLCNGTDRCIARSKRAAAVAPYCKGGTT